MCEGELMDLNIYTDSNGVSGKSQYGKRCEVYIIDTNYDI